MHKKNIWKKTNILNFISKAKIIIFPNMIPHLTLGNLKDIIWYSYLLVEEILELIFPLKNVVTRESPHTHTKKKQKTKTNFPQKKFPGQPKHQNNNNNK